MKVTTVAEQMVVPGLASIVTDGVSDEIVCMVSELDSALVEVKQFVVPLKEMLQVTISPSASVEVV